MVTELGEILMKNTVILIQENVFEDALCLVQASMCY